MSMLRAFKTQLAKIGYPPGAIIEDYVFPDVLGASTVDRSVVLAAFTQTPPSYRNAAMAVLEEVGGLDTATLVTEHRALGAPLLFVIGKSDVAAWQVRSSGPPRVLTRVSLDALDTLFHDHREQWGPLSIQRAKSIGQVDRTYQLDFVDAGLLPAIEGEIQAKLDRLLDEMLADILRGHPRRAAKLDERVLFRTTFRLLAAKVLQDRGHELAARWDPDDLADVLERISSYYRLPPLDEQASEIAALFGPAWARLRRGLNFRNISADDLAFVYENTLVTPEARKHFGTHSTPRQVADYVVSRLELWRYSKLPLRIYEPFAGAGVFLVAALRHLREQLPSHWSDLQRHRFLVGRIAGDELDAFACEVARLSLILADYPNANGWELNEVDLFADNELSRRLANASVVLCNPPFESFTPRERAKYPKISARSYSKPIATLNAVLDAAPLALGFVLPRPFLTGAQYAEERRRLEQLYRNIELVSLPDRTFNASDIRSAALIARDRRPARGKKSATTLRSTTVTEGDRQNFLRAGQVTHSRVAMRWGESTGTLWIDELDELWRYLGDRPRLSSVAEIHRGLEWKYEQALALRPGGAQGAARGLLRASSVSQFGIGEPSWLDVRPEAIRRAHELPWDRPKVLTNAARLSRGPWCLAAAPDFNGLVASQQLFCIWVRRGEVISVEQLTALLNSPLANAYIDTHCPPDRIRNDIVKAIPMPVSLPDELGPWLARYTRAIKDANENLAQALLTQIDALILKGYDLPPRLERQLLEHFRGAERPTVHPWTHWYPATFTPAIPLHEFVSEEFARVRTDWLQDVFRELPPNEASALREYMD